MKLRATLIFLAAALQFLLPLPSPGQSVDLGGMISLLSSARFDARFEPVASFSFIPEVKFSLFSRRGVTVDAETSPKKGTQYQFPNFSELRNQARFPDRSTEINAGVRRNDEVMLGRHVRGNPTGGKYPPA